MYVSPHFCVIQLSQHSDSLVNIESEGPYAPQDFFPAAIRVLRARVGTLKRATEALACGEDPEAGGSGSTVEGAADGDVVMMES